MIRAFRGIGIAAAAAVIGLGLPVAAQSDNFMSECQQGSSAADPVKACTCMSGQGDGRRSVPTQSLPCTP